MAENVRLELDDGVAIVRLDRPPANAIDLQLATELGAAIEEAAGRDDVGALVVWGGERIFAAGADIKAMVEWGPEEVRPSVDALGAACDLLESTPKVSIAAVNGFALGGGLELALGADLRYLADDATIGQPEIKLGVIPGAGGTQRLTRLIGPGRTRDLVYSGRLVQADEAQTLGIADRVLPAAETLPAAVEAARAFARGPRSALAAAKAAVAAALAPGGAEGIDRERQLFLGLFGSPDQREGMRAFLDKREPRFGSD
jgi:enoyl-CoA hydratase/carnithine racemase